MRIDCVCAFTQIDCVCAFVRACARVRRVGSGGWRASSGGRPTSCSCNVTVCSCADCVCAGQREAEGFFRRQADELPAAAARFRLPAALAAGAGAFRGAAREDYARQVVLRDYKPAFIIIVASLFL